MLNNLFEKRAAISYQTLFNLGGTELTTTEAGVAIDSDRALGLTGVWSAISLTADTIATLPLKGFVKDSDGFGVPLDPQPEWLVKPDPDTTRVVWLQSLLVACLLDGHAFGRIYRSGDEITAIVPLNPIKMRMRRGDGGRIEYHYNNKPIPARDVLSVPYLVRPGEVRGVSPIKQLAQNLGLAVALETYTARFFGSGANPGIVLQTDGELTAEQIADLRTQLENRHGGLFQSHRPMVLQGGIKTEKTQNANDQNQLIESRRFAIEDIARIYNIPPHAMGLPGYNSYASVEESNLQWISHQLRPLATKFEAALTDLMPPTQYVKFNFAALERGNITSRFTAYNQASNAGWLSADEIRTREELPVINSATSSKPRVPLANIDMDAADLKAQEIQIAMAVKLIQAGFEESATLAALGLPPIPHTGGIPVTLQNENP